jgi:excinuclease ABC subunit C
MMWETQGHRRYNRCKAQSCAASSLGIPKGRGKQAMGKGLFAREAFTGFGRPGLSPDGSVPPLYVLESRRAARLRQKVRTECPRQPGVYGMVDATGELIYVGKAKCLRSRLLSYFRHRSRDPKAGDILRQTRVLAWEPGPTEFGALLRELELIRRWQPRFNVQGQPKRRRRVYVCVGRRPAPYVFLARRPPATASVAFGPVSAGWNARESVRRLNDWYRLRDCPQAQQMVFADQAELFPVLRAAGCIRHEIGNCLGPCAAACSRADYRANVQAALAFLEGRDGSPLEMLEREMVEASAALAFERAAALRDKLEVLRWLTEHLQRVRNACRHSFVYPVPAHDGSELWYLVRRGGVCSVLPAPRDDDGRRTAAAALEVVYGRGGKVLGPPGAEEVDGVLLVAAWFRKYAAERQRLLTPDAARALCG